MTVKTRLVAVAIVMLVVLVTLSVTAKSTGAHQTNFVNLLAR